MKNRQTLSVVISAYNEEEKIADCLDSVKDIADEIVFVDNESSDRTPELAARYTKQILSRPNNPMLNINKNFGIEHATGDWILVLDADERLTEGGREEMKRILLSGTVSMTNGYYIPRKNIIFGKWIEHAGWYPDYQLRLIRRGKGMFPARHVHEMMSIEGTLGHLKEPMVHLNYETIQQFLTKMTMIYTTNEAEQLLANGYELSWHDAIRFPIKEFLSRYFARAGYKDGLHGLVISLLMAFYHLVVFTKVWEKKKFIVSKEITLLDVKQELKHSGKEYKYWILTERIQKETGFLKKIILRILRKLQTM